MQRYQGRRVIVTGGASGIGQATVARLLDEGADVMAFDVDPNGLGATAKAADAAGVASRLATAELDIGDEAAVKAGVDAAIGRLGGLDVLVNAAGIQRSAHTHEQSLEGWEHLLRINLTGTFLMTRQALPALCDSGRGVVVNFSSTSAQFAHPYVAAYAASKGGVQALTHCLAIEYASKGLRAVNIQPGGVSTPMSSNAVSHMPGDSDWSLFAKVQPLLNAGALSDPASVAAVIAMVASDDGAAVTGTEIRVDSGAHA